MQESGGEKIPWGGHRYLSVPTRYLREMFPRSIPAELRIGNVLHSIGSPIMTRKRHKGMMPATGASVRGLVFFLHKLKDGKRLFVMARQIGGRTAFPFYLLIPDAMVTPRFEMEHTVDRAVQEVFPELWTENWKQIMEKGLRVT